MVQDCPDFRIGPTAATLRDVTWYGIPYPVESPYLPYSVVRKCGNGDEKGYGYPACTWTWETMSQSQVYALLTFFDEDTDASVDVYIRTYKDVGERRETGDFQAKMFRPLDGSGKSLQPRTRFWYAGVTVRFAHMVEE